MRCLALLAAVVLLPGSAFALTINFEASGAESGLDDPADRPSIFGEGVPITDVITGADRGFYDDGVGVTFDIQTNIGSAGPLVLFDSNCLGTMGANRCTGGDPDLATGPTFGSDPQGLVLIVQEINNGSAPGSGGLTNTSRVPGTDPNRRYLEPDDAVGNDANPLNISIDFVPTVHEFGGTIEDVVLLDQEFQLVDGEVVASESVQFFGTRRGATFELVASDIQLLSTNAGSNGDNSVIRYAFDTGRNLDRFTISFSGSGAIEILNFRSSMPRVPLPPAALMLMAGIGAIGAMRLRQRNAQARAA